MANTATWNCTATVEAYPVPRVAVTIGDGSSSTGLGVVMHLMRTDAAGNTVEVRVPAYNPGSGTDEVVYDYEAPQGGTYTYQVHLDTPGLDAALDAYGERLPVTVATPDVGAFLIPTVGDQSIACPLEITGDGFTGWAETVALSTVQIIGSDMPFGVSQTMQAPAGQVITQQWTPDAQDALRAVLKTPGAKYLSLPASYWAAPEVAYAFISAQHVPQAGLLSPWWVSTLTLVPSARPAVVPVASIQPMGAMTVTAAMGVTVTEAMNRTLT